MYDYFKFFIWHWYNFYISKKFNKRLQNISQAQYSRINLKLSQFDYVNLVNSMFIYISLFYVASIINDVEIKEITY